MRLAQISTREQANRFLEITFWPFWNQRFRVQPALSGNAHRRVERTQHLEEILSVRVARTVASDHTVSWKGKRWGLRREQVCVGLRGARAEIERRLDGSHWLRFRGRYLPLRPCPNAPRSASPSGLRPPGLVLRKPKLKHKTNIKTKCIPPPDHPLGGHFNLAENRTFLLCVDTESRRRSVKPHSGSVSANARYSGLSQAPGHKFG